MHSGWMDYWTTCCIYGKYLLVFVHSYENSCIIAALLVKWIIVVNVIIRLIQV